MDQVPKAVTYTIEKGVPLPRMSGGARIYPFRDMEVGDSFLARPREGMPAIMLQKRISSCICAFQNRHPGRRFATRIEGDGVRVWRVPPPRLMLDQSVPPPVRGKVRTHTLGD